MITTHLDNLAIGELRTNAKGGNCANVSHKSGKPIVIVATAPLTCPFGAGVYQGDGSEAQLNIDYSALEDIEPMFRNIDEQLIQAATAAKDHLWPGKGLRMHRCVRITLVASKRERTIPRPFAVRLTPKNADAGPGRVQKSYSQ